MTSTPLSSSVTDAFRDALSGADILGMYYPPEICDVEGGEV